MNDLDQLISGLMALGKVINLLREGIRPQGRHMDFRRIQNGTTKCELSETFRIKFWEYHIGVISSPPL
jgi:hypothetical protein